MSTPPASTLAITPLGVPELIIIAVVLGVLGAVIAGIVMLVVSANKKK